MQYSIQFLLMEWCQLKDWSNFECMKFETDWSLKSFFWPNFQFFLLVDGQHRQKTTTGDQKEHWKSGKKWFQSAQIFIITILSGTFGTISWERNSSWNATSPFPTIGFFGGWMFWLFWWRPRWSSYVKSDYVACWITWLQWGKWETNY